MRMSRAQKALVRKYDDSRSGVLQMLKDISIFDVRRARVIPDPSVEGVWKVSIRTGKFKGVNVIAYLAGYNDPLGKKRGQNDFEDF